MGMRQKIGSVVAFCFLALTVVPVVSAQDVLEQRLIAVEQYLQNIQPTLVDFSERMQQGIQEYTTQLEASLADFSQNLQSDVEQRLMAVNNRITVLNPTTRAFQRIDTNTGTFLIAVDKMEQVSGGYRLTLNIGNPNYADYRDFNLQIFWGAKWDPNSSVNYDQWRGSLRGAEYTFNGALKRGEWQQIEVDLVPANANTMSYLECKMNVLAVELKQPQ